MPDQFVVPYGDGWAVKSAGASRISKTFDRQQDAIDCARERAKNQASELIIKNKHGIIRQKNSYGNDPYPPRG